MGLLGRKKNGFTYNNDNNSVNNDNNNSVNNEHTYNNEGMHINSFGDWRASLTNSYNIFYEKFFI